MYNTNTQTKTYTVIDIRKTFENFEADVRMIARITDKWTMKYVDDIFHDIIELAENEYLESVDIALIDDASNEVIKASKFKVNSNGTSSASDRPGKNNDWEDIPNTHLRVILSYSQEWYGLSHTEKQKFQNENGFKIGWVKTSIDNTFPHLQRNNKQLYASNGYELQKVGYN
ncbi:MAG: hypothetical protein DWQ06_13645 [Calditrichaeota bacterium]|nr:MAG: hypothetical protein DWQ06_13645 [Calditrichota bacterium]